MRLLMRIAQSCAIIVVSLLAFLSVARAETIDWNGRPATNLRTGGTDAPTYGAAPSLLTVTTSGTSTGGYNGTPTLAIQPTGTSNGFTGFINSTIDADSDDETDYQTTTITFTEPVYNVSVIVGDIDGGPTFTITTGAGTFAFNDIVEFRAIDAVTGATILPTSGTPATASVTWNAATGRALSTNTNITNGDGNITVTWAGPIKSFTVRHYSAANSNVTNPTGQFIFIDTVTFTRSPRLAITKTSTGGVGTFNFSNSNGFTFTGPSTFTYGATTTSVTTLVAGTPVTGSFNRLGTVNTATTITETGPLGWALSGANAACADSNSAVSGNPATFNAPITANAFVIAATNVRAGAIITCSITNVAAAPALTVDKTASPTSVANVGEVITYTIAVTNAGNVTLNSVTVTDPLGTVTCPVSGTNVIATLLPGASQNCSLTYAATQADFDNNGGGDGDIDNTASAASTYNAAPVNASDSVAVALNLRQSLLTTKSASPTGPVSVGTTITYTYIVKNTGNQTLSNINLIESFNGYNTAPVPGGEVLHLDAAPAGGSSDGGTNGIWQTLGANDEVRFTATYMVNQTDIDLLQ
jgi:uncharacterized repeat protein (TIGR01451 family)